MVFDRMLGVQLNLSKPDLGIPGGERLLAQLHHAYDPGRLYCVEAHEHGGVGCPGYMTIVVRKNKPYARHVNFGEIRETPGESDQHKMLKEHTAAVATHHGFEAVLEETGPGGKRRTDVVVTGDAGRKIGYEIQLSSIAPGTVDRRTARAKGDGLTPMWVVTSNNAIPIDRATWARVDVQTWRDTRTTDAFPVRGGVKALKMLRCDRRNPQPCPDRATGRCGGHHGVWEPVSLRYEDLIGRTASGDLVPLYMERKDGTRGWHMWVTPADKTEFLQGRPEPSPEAFRRRERAAAQRALIPRPDDPRCHYRDESALRTDLATARDSGEPIDASHWLSHPPQDHIIDGYTIPGDLVALKRDWDTTDAECSTIVDLMPQAVDIVTGRALPPTELQTALDHARAERLGITLEIHRHPWWRTVTSRTDAETALRRGARDRPTTP